MNRKMQQVKRIWAMLNESERYGIKFGLFPMRILEVQKKLKVTASDLIGYAESVQP